MTQQCNKGAIDMQPTNQNHIVHNQIAYLTDITLSNPNRSALTIQSQLSI